MMGRNMMAIRHLKVARPTHEKRTVEMPVRKPNSKYRTREHLTEPEIKKLINAAKDHRHGQRDFNNGAPGLQAWPEGLRAG